MAGVFRDRLLEGRHAFVTGGGSGINLRIAERLAEHGARVVVLGRTQEKLDRAVAGIEAAGGTALGLTADVREYDALSAALAEAHGRFGDIDVLVCGAAGNFLAPAIGMSANAFKAVVDIDLLGTYNACRAAFEHLRKPGASVLAISATQATTATPFQSHACAAKAGVELLIKTLALEWGGIGIRANTLVPGPIEDTEGMARLSPGDEHKRRLEELMPARRWGTRDEVADLALYLCSDAAGFITGASFHCDGGLDLLGAAAVMPTT